MFSEIAQNARVSFADIRQLLGCFFPLFFKGCKYDSYPQDSCSSKLNVNESDLDSIPNFATNLKLFSTYRVYSCLLMPRLL